MFNILILLAEARSDFDRYMDENPFVLGCIAGGLGLVIGGWGLVELLSGTSRDKWGNKVEGINGQLLAIVRIVFGVAAILFGLYKMMAG